MSPLTGWIPFAERTTETNEAHDRIVATLPQFRIMGDTADPGRKKVDLTESWKSPEVQGAIGYEFPRIHQLTGSCVGAGGGNAWFTTEALDVLLRGLREQILVPFWLFTYGKSRLRAGLRGQGEGSIGSAWAEAITTDGILSATFPGLPSFDNSDGLTWSADDEMRWSDGARIPSQFATEANKYKMGSAAKANVAGDVRDGILNGYVSTDACDGFCAHAQVRGSGENAVVVGDIDSNGGHQTSIQGYWDHPDLGPLYKYQNNWPKASYPSDPQGGSPCAVWITEKRMDWICRTGEVYVLSKNQGFPAQDIAKALFRVLGG